MSNTPLTLSRRTLLGATIAGAAVVAGPRVVAHAEGTPSPQDLYIHPLLGRDDNSGGVDAPLRTLDGALAMATQRLSQGSGNVTIWLRGGRYELSTPLELPVLPSGGTIAWRAYPGETPVVSGAHVVRNWRETVVAGRTAWVTAAPTGQGKDGIFRSLYVNDGWRPRPVFPAVMHEVVSSHQTLVDLPRALPKFLPGTPAAKDSTAFSYSSGALQSNWRNQSDIDLVTPTASFDERMPIRHIADGWAQVHIRPTPGDEAWQDRHFYLDNVGEALSQPGQWYLDRSAGTLTYLPLDGETLGNTQVLAPHLTRLMRIEGTLERPAGGHSFDGLHFAHVDRDYAPFKRRADGTIWMLQQGGACVDAAISMTNVRDVSFTRCDFSAMGGTGLEILSNSRRVTVTGCNFFDLGGGGLKVSSDLIGPGHDTYSTGWITVQDCTVRNFGRVFHLATGILVQGVHHATVQYNEVHHGFYSGISLGWSWDYQSRGVRDNLVKSNHVHHLGLGLLSDLGGIYTVGRQDNTYVTDNHVHHVNGYVMPSTGIYLDQASSLIEVTGNTVHHAAEGIWAPNDAAGLVIKDNIVADNARTQIRVGGGESRYWLGGVSSYAAAISNNVVASNGSALIETINRAITSDNNVLWNYDGSLDPQNGISSVSVEIVDLATGLVVASTHVPAVGVGGNACVFASLDEPVVLEANHEYVVALLAMKGGAAWHQPPIVSTTSVASVVSDTFEWMPAVYSRGSNSKCFGPVNFTYATAQGQQRFVTGTSRLDLVDQRNDFSGHVGMLIKTGSAPLTVGQLGAWPLTANDSPLDEWRGQGYDHSSIVADPGFSNRAAGNYSLRSGSAGTQKATPGNPFLAGPR
ncbi:right-handed parallel beta-helix repeat-containing protein [Luteococcus sanguinis]|uniref:Right-handed parallel beta-helix repeat-containing protein n=1 Tax=Luteococcus sanguinis TaxID=174038 RepID=A0ABW1X2Z1_9ACTN